MNVKALQDQFIDLFNSLAYFRAARSLVDLPNCGRSLQSLQTVTCIITYLFAIGSVTVAHTIVGNAATAVLRLGLHVPSISPAVSRDKQLWYNRTYRGLKALDTQIGALLGLPSCLQMGIDALDLESNQVEAAQPDAVPADGVENAANMELEALAILSTSIKGACFSGQTAGSKNECSILSLSISQANNQLEDWGKSSLHLSESGLVTTIDKSK